MGLKRAWVYDSVIPAQLAEELSADGYERPLSTGRRASIEEKSAALERHSLSASGELESEDAHEWSRVSVASRAHELKTRMKKLRGKSRRTSSLASSSLDEDTQRELGLLDDFGAWPRADKAGVGGDREVPGTLYCSTPRYPGANHQQTVSEPVVIDTVDDLLRHLERIGRLKPSLTSFTTPSIPTALPVLSVSGSETEADSGDSSTSQPSTESGSEIFASNDELMIDQTTGEDGTVPVADVEKLAVITDGPILFEQSALYHNQTS